MKSTSLATAKRVMKRLLAHPGASIFTSEAVPGPDFPEDYFEVIKNPIDLTEIGSRLRSNRYRSVSDWRAAVNRCFDNAVSYWGEGTIADLALEMRSVFERECRVFDVMTLDGWSKEVMAVRDKISRLSRNPPTSGAFAIGGIDASEPILPQLPTQKEMKALATAVRKMKNQEAHNGLADLIRNEEPYLPIENREERISLVGLKPSTFFKVRDFVKVQLEEEGVPYPSP